MAYSHECPICGANLDPGEKCECKKETQIKRKLKKRSKEYGQK